MFSKVVGNETIFTVYFIENFVFVFLLTMHNFHFVS
jgi:hypothetical protein